MSLVKVPFRPVRDRLDGASCRSNQVKPSWWTDEHKTNGGHLICMHELARHICYSHCPVLQECREDMVQEGQHWYGMVVAGEVRGGQSKPTHFTGRPKRPELCPLCP